MSRLSRAALGIVVGLLCVSQVQARTLHSSDLGWKPGQDVTSQFNSFLRSEGVGILIEDCLFHDLPNAIVLSTIDGGRRKGPGKELLTAANMKKYAPHDIEIKDCIVGHVEKPLRPKKKGGYGVNRPSKAGEHMRAIHLKDAYGIRYRDLRLLGGRIKVVRHGSIGGSRHLSKEAAEAIDHSVTGNVLEEPAPPIQPGQRDVPFACGPQ